MGLMDWDEDEYLKYTGDVIINKLGEEVLIPDDPCELIEKLYPGSEWVYNNGKYIIETEDGDEIEHTFEELRDMYSEQAYNCEDLEAYYEQYYGY